MRLLLLLVLVAVASAASPNLLGYFSPSDLSRLEQLFLQPQPDLASAYFAVLGASTLGKQTSVSCSYLQENVDASSLESVYYAVAASALLKGCTVKVDAKPALATAFVATNSAEKLFMAQAVAVAYKEKVPADLWDTLKSSVQQEDSVANIAYGIRLAAALTGKERSKYLDRVEDLVNLADEVDGRYLQFDAGVFTSALVVDSAYSLATVLDKKPIISDDQLVKFANYFCSRRLVKQVKGAAMLVSAAQKLSRNKWRTPAHVSLAGSDAITETASTLTLRVTDLLGAPVEKLSLTVESAKQVTDGAVVMNNMKMTAAGQGQFTVDFTSAVKPPAGLYQVRVKLSDVPATVIAPSEANFEARVMTSVSVANAKVGVADRDQATAPRTQSLTPPAKTELDVDYHQKIVLDFDIRDERRDQLFTPHQVFCRFVSDADEEVIFVVEPGQKKHYNFELDVNTMSKEFAGKSGTYRMTLLVGDSVITTPIAWEFATAKLKFAGSAKTTVSASKGELYQPRKEIHHTFRKPDPRPPATVSLLFTGLILLPALVMLVSWLRLGVNISGLFSSNLPLAAVFHFGFAAIFGLYYCYWINLTMFETLKWLVVLSVPTFYCGNRLLRNLGKERIESKKE